MRKHHKIHYCSLVDFVFALACSTGKFPSPSTLVNVDSLFDWGRCLRDRAIGPSHLRSIQYVSIVLDR